MVVRVGIGWYSSAVCQYFVLEHCRAFPEVSNKLFLFSTGAHLKLKDPRWALAVETCLRGLCWAFCVDNIADQRVLEKIFSQVGGRKPTIITSKFLVSRLCWSLAVRTFVCRRLCVPSDQHSRFCFIIQPHVHDVSQHVSSFHTQRTFCSFLEKPVQTSNLSLRNPVVSVRCQSSRLCSTCWRSRTLSSPTRSSIRSVTRSSCVSH